MPSWKIERKEVTMELISLKGPHRIVRFTRGEGGDGHWYRSETLLRGLSLGSTYGTLAEAEHDFLYTILAEVQRKEVEIWP
jgi:hypothetical protein